MVKGPQSISSATSSHADAEAEGSTGTGAVTRERRPYVAPRLRHLGSVRDLTLGSSNKALEGGRRNM